MDYSYMPISNLQLLLSVLLVLITGLISALFQLGLLRSLLWGTMRAFLQLTIIGYALTWIFKINHPLLILAILLLMAGVASRETTRRLGKIPIKTKSITFLCLIASTFVVGLIVVAVIIQPKPFYHAQVLIPIFGMIMGNSMNAIALALERMYSEIHTHVGQVEQMLAMGATPWESVQTYVRRAVSAGMTPTINALMVVGLVSLPGMMTGQILAGMDPVEAVRYQFVVLIMMAAAVAIGCMLIILLSYRKLFTEDQALIEDIHGN